MKKQSYLLFLNSKELNNYQGFIGLGLRELLNDEMTQYCSNSIKQNKPPSYVQQTNSNKYLLTSDFYFVAYISGCYYIDQSTGKWSSNGLKVMNDTTLTYTHCKSNHLTTFASGFEFFPETIDFNYVYAHLSFEQNKTIYLTVVILVAVYILFSIWGRWMDKQDYFKIGVTPLIDNSAFHDYFMK